MRSYDTAADIAAPPDAVWSVLSDVAAFPEWDSGVEKVDGAVAPGAKLKVYSEVNPGRGYPIKVAEVEPGRRMVWTGGMPLGLFKGVRTYTLTPVGDGGTRFTMREEFTGPMLPLIWRSMPDMGPSFDKFARGLKARVEGDA